MSSIVEKCRADLCAVRRFGRPVVLAASLLVAMAFVTTPARAQVPPNDNFVNAIPLVGAFGSVTGTTFNATAEVNEPFHAGHRLHSVWYRWIAPTNGYVVFDTGGTYVGSGNFFDTVLAGYVGPGYGQLIQLAANDDYFGNNFSLDSLISFFAVSGVEYHIAIDGFSGDSGNFILNWNQGNGTNLPPTLASNEVTFASSAYGVAENTPGFITVSVVSGGGFTNVSTVDYYTLDGSAIAGEDYLSVSNTLTWAPGETVKTFTIPILDNSIQHSNKTINLVLANATGDAVLSTNGITNAVVTIMDDESLVTPTGAGQLNFIITNNFTGIGGIIYAGQQVTTIVTENETFEAPWGYVSRVNDRSVKGALVTVTRTAPARGRILVDYHTTNTFITNYFGTNFYYAQPGIDYQPVSGTLVFDDAQMMANFIVPVGNRFTTTTPTNLFPTPLFFDVVLSNPRPAPEEDPQEIQPTIGVGQASVEILKINNYSAVSIERRTYRVDEYNSFARGGTNVLRYVTNDVVVTNIVGTNVVVQTNQVGIRADYFVDIDLILPGGGCGNCFVDVEANVYGFFLQPGSDYADGFPRTLDDTPATDGAAPIINRLDYGPLTNGIGDLSNFGNAGRLVRVTFPNGNTTRATVRIVITNDTVVEFNEDIGIYLSIPPGSGISRIGNGFASATILYDDEPAGAADREWNPEGVLYTNPRFNDTPGANNTVAALVVQPDDKTVIAGDFTHFNSFSRNHIARINFDGSIDTTFNPGTGADGPINAMALYPTNSVNPAHAGKIVIGGFFTSYNGALRNGIARVNPDGSLDGTFAPGNGVDGIIYSLALQNDGKIVVAGDFTTFNGNNVNGIMRLNADGSLDTSFNPGTGANGPIWAIALREPANEPRTIVVGGDFSSFNDQAAPRLVRLTDSGDVDPTFDAGLGADQTVYALAVQQDGKVLVGGTFNTFHTSPRSSLARVNTDGSLDSSYNVGVGLDGSVYAITLQPDGKALIGGPFTSYNNTRRMGLARVHVTGVLDTSFMDTAYNHFAGFPKTFSFDNPSFVNAIGLQSDGNVMIGGSFTNMGGNLSIHYDTTNYTTTARSVTNSTLFTFLGFDYQPINGRTNGHNGGAHLFAPFTRQDKTTRHNVARVIGNYTPGPGNLEYDPNSTFTANENNGTLAVTLRRVDGRLGTAVAVPFTTNNTAQFPLDFSSATSTQRWEEFTPTVNAVQTRPFSPRSVGYVGPRYFEIPIIDDTLAEGDETFGLAITNAFGSINLGGELIPLGAALGHLDAALATVADNEFNKGIFNFGQVAFSTNEMNGSAVITVIRTNGSSGAVTVDYLTRDGSATAGSDYTFTRGQLRFASGETNKTFTIPILDNPEVEFDETIVLVLTNATGGAKLPGGLPTSVVTNTLTIVDNDFLQGRINFSVSSFTNNENDVVGRVTVTRTGGSQDALSVNFATINGGTATPNADFVPTNGTLTWVSGDSTAQTILIPLLSDGVVEGPESVLLRLSNPSFPGALGSRTNATLWITDGDAYGSLSFNQSYYEADENGSSPTITVVRSGGSAGTVTVQYQTTPIVATPGADYNDVSGTLTFAPGEFSKTFVVPLVDDSVPDGDKSVQITLSNPTLAGLGLFTNVVLNMVDNESISLPAGSLDTTFTTNANADAAVYALAQQADGRIIMAGDFTRVSGVPRNRLARLKQNGVLDNTFDIGPGANGAIRAVALDSIGELYIAGDFTQVNGTNRNGVARLSTDGTLDASFNPGAGADNGVNALVLQPNEKILLGGSFVAFNGITRPGVVRLNTNGTVDTSFNVGSGIAGTVYALAVQNDGKVLVGGLFDSFNGLPRQNLLRLNPNGSLDTSFNPAISIDSAVRSIVVQPDGNIVIGGSFTSVNGATRRYLARIDRDGFLDTTFLADPSMGADNTVYVVKQQVDGRLLVAGDFSRFNGVTRNGITRLFVQDGGTDPTINFGNGANGFVAALLIQPDRRIVLGGGFTAYDDKPRQYIARIYGGAIAGSGSIEYSAPRFVVDETSTNAVISVRRIGGTAGDVAVDYATSGGTAIPGVQYQPTSGTLNFPTGETRLTFTVPLITNNIPDGDRTIGLVLSNFVGAAMGPQPFSTLVVVDDESVVEFQVSSGATTANFVVNENAAGGNGTVTVVRRGGTNTILTVEIATTGGTATPGADYVATNGVITFLPGELAKHFNVQIVDDSDGEVEETVTLALSNPSGFTQLGVATATLRIVSNESAPGSFGFATNSFFVDESAGLASITIVRENGASSAATVRFVTSNGTATNGLDYVGTNRIVSFAIGETNKVVTFPIINDSIAEPYETVILTLTTPTGGAGLLPARSTALLTIADDEFGTSFVGFQTNLFRVNEADGFATITITRTNNRRGTIEVDFTVANGTATAGVDYVFTNGTVTLLDNEAEKSFTVAVIDDPFSEGDETVLLTLSNVRSTDTAVLPALLDATLVIADRAVPISGAVDPTFAGNIGANATVHSVSFDAQQRLIVGGEFTQVYGLPINRIARMTTNGAADFSFKVGSGANDIVLSVAAVTNVVRGTNFSFATNTIVTTNATNIIITTNTAPVVGTAVYAGGSFTNFNGFSRPRIVRLNDDGSVDLTFNPGTGANGAVRAIAQAGLDVILAGDFSFYNGRVAGRIVRVDTFGNVATNFATGSGANGPIYSVAVQPNGQVVVAGDFSTFNGSAAGRVARLNADGSLDTSFNVGFGADDIVRSVAVQADGKVLVGGSFLSFNGVPRAHLVRLNLDGTVDLTFNTGGGFGGGDVRSIALQSDGKVLAVGSFRNVAGNAINRIARLNTDGSLDTFFAIGSGANARVNSVATYVFPSAVSCVTTGVVVLDFEAFAGDTNSTAVTNFFTNCISFFGPTGSVFHVSTNGVTNSAAAELRATDGRLLELNLSGQPFTLAQLSVTAVSGPVLVTSSSGGAALIQQSGFATFDSLFANVQWVRIQPLSGSVTLDDIYLIALPLPTVVSTDRIGIGGDFTRVSDVPRGRVAVLDPTGALDATWDPGAMSSHAVYAIDLYTPSTNNAVAPLTGRVVAGGDFTALVGVEGINYLGRLTANGTLDLTFTNGTGANAAVRAVAIQPDGKVVAGGFFTNYNGVPRNRMVRVNTDGTVDTNFNFGVGFDNAVLALAIQPDGKIVAGGNFTMIYGAPRAFIGRVNTNGVVDTNFLSSADGPVHAVVIQPDGKVIIGGLFTRVNGTLRSGIARLNSDGSLDLTFNPGSGANGAVNAIALTPSGQILIGGAFSQVNGATASRIARLNADGSFDNSFNVGGTGANDYVNAIHLQADGKILVGGNFTVFNGQVRNRIVRLLIDGSLDPVVNFGLGANNFVAALAVQPDAKILAGGGFTTFDTEPRVGIVRLLGGDNVGNGAFQFAATNYVVTERSNTVTIAVVRTGSTLGAASVDYTTVNGTATSPANYTAVSGTLNFASAENVRYITIPITDNGTADGDRYFTVQLSNPTGGTTLSSNQVAYVTIRDNDSVISFSDATYAVVENGIAARITVVRSGGITDLASVDFVTLTNGTATANVDFTPRTTRLVFNPGVRSLTVDVPVIDDSIAEFNETVPLMLLNATGASLGTTNALLTIIEDDFGGGVFTFATNSYFLSEDGVSIVIDVYRTNGHSGVVSVNFATLATGTAIPGTDFVATNGTLTFADGQTNASFTIRVLDDFDVEGNETVPIVLSAPTGGASIGGGAATLTIVDNDAPGQFAFVQPVYSVSETGAFATITVIRTNGNLGNVSVRLQTAGGSATPTVDYQPVDTVLTFNVGQSARTVTIPILNDAIVEGTETVGLLLLDPQPPGGGMVGPTVLTPSAVLNIIDDEVSVSFSQAQFTVVEGFTSAVLSVDRRGDTNGSFTVGVGTSSGTAIAGQDFVNTTLTLTFAPGETNKTFLIAILGDTIPEGNESFNVTLQNPSPGVLLAPRPSAEVVIVDDDIGFAFSQPVYSVTESNTLVTVTVLRLGSPLPAVSVDYGTAPGTATPGFGFDYLSVTGNLAFASGVVSNTFTVQILDDALVEGDETVLLFLSNPSPGTSLGGQANAVINIVDSDTLIGFSSTNYVVAEADGTATITLVRSGSAANAVSVGFRTQPLTAQAGVDYTTVTNFLSWPAGDLTPRTVTVPITRDGVAEGVEMVRLVLDNAGGGATVDPLTGTSTLNIVDNGGAIAFASVTYNVVETDGSAVMNLVRSGGTNGTVSVNWTVIGGTAVNGQDYFGNSGTVVFAQGETQKAIVLGVGDDAAIEGLETVTLALTSASGGATIGSPSSAVLRILDSDAGVIIGAGSALVFESFTPTNNIIESNEVVTLRLALRNNGVVDDNVTATLVYSNGTGVGPTNAIAATNLQQHSYGTLFAGGAPVWQPFTFRAIGATGSRLNVTLLLTNSAGVFLGDVTFSYTIGRHVVPFANGNAITINDMPTTTSIPAPASPYPATITVSGVGGPVNRLTVTLANITHAYPDDLDILLVGPNGQAVMLMSDAGLGGSGTANALNNATLTFDDGAAVQIPDSGVISNGTYRCANWSTVNDPMSGFPLGTAFTNTSLATFNGINPNGVWSLYIVDDKSQDAGVIAGGWSLSIDTAELVIPGADIALSVVDSPDPVATNGVITYTISVTNYGPAAASSVSVTNTLPPGAQLISAFPARGTAGSSVILDFGNLAAGVGTNGTITVTAPGVPGTLTFNAVAGAGESDLNTANNTVSIQTSVIDPSAPTPPVPQLRASRSGNSLVLSWPTTAGVVLETRSTMSSGSWVTASDAVVTSNGVSTVTVPLSGTTSFYRLKRTP